MDYRDFFALVFKLFGLYQVISFVAMLMGIPSLLIGSSYGMMGYGQMTYVIVFVVQVLIIYLFLFKAHAIVDFLKLSKGFEGKQINIGQMDSRSMLRLSIIILATYFIAIGVSGLLSQFANYLNIDPALLEPQTKRQTLLQSLLTSYSTYNIILGVIAWYTHEKIVNVLVQDRSESS